MTITLKIPTTLGEQLRAYAASAARLVRSADRARFCLSPIRTQNPRYRFRGRERGGLDRNCAQSQQPGAG